MFTKIYIHIINTPDTYKERTYKGLQELVVERTMADKRGQHKGGQMGDGSRFGIEYNDDNEYDNVPPDNQV